MRSLFFLILSLLTLGYLAPIHKAIAQLTPDSSLGAESSVVNPNVVDGVDLITGGSTRNSNLFHSFQDFNVNAGRGVYFSNPAGIANILTRVTGGNPSSIQGVLGVVGNANLFLINPRGISFGPNASLDLRGGSFFSTTADSVLFDNFEFSASNPQAVPQLTINIPIGLRFRDNPDGITHNVNTIGFGVQPGKTLALVGGNVSLDQGIVYAPGARVELGGLSQAGTVGLNPDGSLSFPSNVTKADVSLANLATVNVAGEGGGSINVNARNFDLFEGGDLIAGIASGSGTLSSQAGDIVVNASGAVKIEGNTNTSRIRNVVFSSGKGNAGNVIINANSLEGTGNFIIGSLSFGEGNAGKVNITATDKVSLQGLEGQSSGISSTVGSSSTGSANDVVIDTRSLSLSNFAALATSTTAKGNAGNIRIKASESVSVSGNSTIQAATFASGNAGKIIIDSPNANVSFDQSLVSTSVFGNSNISGVDLIGTGQGGDIEITARSLSLDNGSQLFTGTFGFTGENGPPNAGNINLNISESLNVRGTSRLRSQTEGDGKAGNIQVKTGSLLLTDGSQFNSSTFGKGDAGFININVIKDAIFDGIASNGNPSGVASEAVNPSEGNAGSIDISANNLFLRNGARISVSTFGQGNAGAIKITAGDTLSVDGLGTNNVSSSISSLVGGVVPQSSGDRKGGDISINAGSLSLTNGGQIIASTFSKGDAGNITINIIKDAILDGVGSNQQPSAIASEVDTNGNGNGGSIDLSANNLFLKNGARISTSTFGQGNAGAIKIKAGDTLSVDGIGSNNISTQISSIVAGVVPQSSGDRKGGDISINAGSLSLANRGLIISSTFGKGNAGDISLKVDGPIKLTNSSQIRSNVEQGGEGLGGDINIDTKSLTLTDGSEIGAIVFRAANGLQAGKGKAGNLVINAKDFIDISGTGSTGFSSGIFASAERGTIATQPQAAGDITITTGDFRIANGAVVDASTWNDGSGGSITINAKNFTATDGGQVLTTSRGSGAAGDITLKVSDNLTISGSDPNFNQRIEQAKKFASPDDTIDDIISNQGAQSGIFANTTEGSTGKGGSIFIDPKQVTIKDGGIISATSSGTGEAGNINIQAGNLTLDRGTITAESGSATGGNITLDINDVLLLRRNSLISATAGRNQGAGNGGNININTGLLVALPQENSDIKADAFSGSGGNINIQTDAIFGIQPRDFSTPLSDITASSESGISGNVNLNTLDIDPTQGLSELPENTTDPSNQIAQNPCQKGSNSSFVLSGRGGIPSSPNDSFSSDNVRVDLLQPITSSNNPQNVTNNPPKIQTATKQIIPAQGWIFNEKGEVVLTAYDPTTSGSQRSSKVPASCPAPF
ncbi:MAG: filamentous hemagglutinin N-terminal domain-containing protein [Pelatocladus maniniholoensis HA4357-MV3]|jgi:filamentous hemagglutinin family protein|uniref:Filamentous hemagglutinin N-terminal domain-containing protein n=1 Tax=Pelatocladus maniniholoensis HA4357-MV3 TaxID=1117104 RepID=A0A9E3H6K0_9NOST|nr:filamentous hemagglutinin N-terminal domain-containing protein [Pelatocladus maniniholoensis HA4357-MV3]